MKAKVVGSVSSCACGHSLEEHLHLESVEGKGPVQKFTGACQAIYEVPGCYYDGKPLTYPCECQSFSRATVYRCGCPELHT